MRPALVDRPERPAALILPFSCARVAAFCKVAIGLLRSALHSMRPRPVRFLQLVDSLCRDRGHRQSSSFVVQPETDIQV